MGSIRIVIKYDKTLIKLNCFWFLLYLDSHDNVFVLRVGASRLKNVREQLSRELSTDKWCLQHLCIYV